MVITLINEGLIVMIIGMGTVFVFLTLMIWAMNLSTVILRFIEKYFPEETPVPIKTKQEKMSNENEIALAIACAVYQSNLKGANYGQT